MAFVVGNAYSRRDIFVELGLPPDLKGGPWFTGYLEHQGEYFIFCGVQATGRTGHDYNNRFIGDDLLWHGRTNSTIYQPSIVAMVQPGAIVRVFYRHDDRERFSYAGQAKAVQTFDESPVGVLWSFADDPVPHVEFLPEEVAPSEAVTEGARKTITVNIYERDPTARKRCLDRWGCACTVCGFQFAQKYGNLVRGSSTFTTSSRSAKLGPLTNSTLRLISGRFAQTATQCCTDVVRRYRSRI
ncbi:hypothetical protein AB4Y64_10660 [Lysobacter sp. TAF61]|uniref:hypothetical protein n=1 Tax=Lysobacter sp. TAF61 TaxID=3233072 RepID=UPI003F9CE0F4